MTDERHHHGAARPGSPLDVTREESSFPPLRPAPPRPPRPPAHTIIPAMPLLARIGRFTVLSGLGEGGMGIVYSAYDDQLDRKVAVKVLRGDTMRRDPQARERLLREAQAMARVSHPNIVTVHEVGAQDGEIFIAMEFVRGHSLGGWLQVSPRSWREVVGALVQAGRGLAAAHAAGLIHRDFKPANVLVATDGVVKVLDFGLARAVDSPSPEALAPLRTTNSTSLDTALTRTGTVLGTPAYMAPEQHLGEPATEKSDQFSFCVSLYEALYDQSPFDTTSLLALTHSVTQGHIRDPPAGAAVPAALLQIVHRGLSLDPGKRFPSMPALLAALERTLERRRTPWFVVAGLAVLIGAAGFSAASLRPTEDTCGAAHGELVGLWDERTAEAARAGVFATRVPFAADTWTRVRPRLDAYAQGLVDMRVDACRAHEEGRSSTRLFDMRTACLDQRHASLAAFAAILRRADADVVGKAAAAAAALPPIAACGDTRALTHSVALPDDPALALRVTQIRSTLAEAQAHESAGQSARGLELVLGLDLGDVDDGPALAEVALRRGSLLSETGQHQSADVELSDGLRLALASGHDLMAASIATRRDFVRAARLQRARDVLDDAPVTEGLIARIEGYDQGPELRGDHFNNLGIASAILGQQQTAGHHFEASIAARTAALGADHPQVVFALGNLGLNLLLVDDTVAAASTLESAFQAAEASLGPNHPHLALLAVNLGVARLALEQFGAASQAFDRALALQTALLGPDAPDLHYVHGNLGDLAVDQRRCADASASYRRALRLLGHDERASDPAALQPLVGLAKAAACTGDYVAARAQFERALALAEATLGPGELRLAVILDGLGDMDLKSGDPLRAMASYQRGLAIRQAQLALDSPRLGESYRRIGELHRRQRELDAAAAALEQARALQEVGALADSVAAAATRMRLGELALDRRAADEAREHFARALAIYTAHSDPDTLVVALARFGLARALAAAAGALTPEARALAEQALATLHARGPGFTSEARTIRGWLSPRGK
jgi:tetratricopeptide (TPR) repeat protein/predicted Ser/Thr protein kinase